MSLAYIGFLMFISPAVAFIMDGGRDESDMVSWMMSKPLNAIFLIKALMISGLGFMGIGIAMATRPG